MSVVDCHTALFGLRGALFPAELALRRPSPEVHSGVSEAMEVQAAKAGRVSHNTDAPSAE